MNYIQKKNYNLIVNVYKIVCVCVLVRRTRPAVLLCPVASSLSLSPLL